MTGKLFWEAILKMAAGVLLLGLLLFLPAGTFAFSNGWLLLFVLFVPMFFAGGLLLWKNPALLRRRLGAREAQKEQRGVVGASAAMFSIGFILAGLDFRFSWSHIPEGVTYFAVFVFFLSYLLYAEVIRENRYLSRTIFVETGQKVIDTGLYSVVRHPMYTATVFLFLTMPIILGSFYSFLVFLAYPFIIARRIRYEEVFLEKELSGYRAYREKVKYRLLPFIW